MRQSLRSLMFVLPLVACSSGGMTMAPAGDASADRPADASAPTDGGDEFANAPMCNINGFVQLRGATLMGSAIPPSLIAEGRPTLMQASGASNLSLADTTGMAYVLRFEWNGTLRANEPANLTGAQIFLAMNQGMSAPPLDGPWADQRVCAGSGSRMVLRQSGMQFILRNFTITTGACPGGDSGGADVIEGCYVPNIAP